MYSLSLSLSLYGVGNYVCAPAVQTLREPQLCMPRGHICIDWRRTTPYLPSISLNEEQEEQEKGKQKAL